MSEMQTCVDYSADGEGEPKEVEAKPEVISPAMVLVGAMRSARPGQEVTKHVSD